MAYCPVPFVVTDNGPAPAIMEETSATTLHFYLQKFEEAVQREGHGYAVDTVNHEEWFLTPAELEWLDILYSVDWN